MKHILQKPVKINQEQSYPLWLILHGAYDHADQAIAMFGQEAKDHDAYLLAPQASRPCGDGYCWSFARDEADIRQLFDDAVRNEPIDPKRISLIGFSMGCTMGCWVLAEHPQVFSTFAALSMGSAFEPWEHDDGGIDLKALAHTTDFTKILLAVDQADPYRCAEYFATNLEQFRAIGFDVETFEPHIGVHNVTDEMKEMVLEKLAL